jgi:glutamyl-tRNA synthetase
MAPSSLDNVMNTNRPRFRFAPSPTGFFHVGGARTALFNWALAKRLGGTFVLRIEDTDEARNRPEWTEGIIEALAWLGIHADDPTFEGPYFQSHHVEDHVAAATQLYRDGLAYYCDLTTEQIAERAATRGGGGYDGYSRERGLEPGPGRVLRFRVPDGVSVVDDAVRGQVEFDHTNLEDFVLLRGNGSPMFLLANVVDDLRMGITHVLRAEEHLPNTPKQQLLWEALGHRPPQWAHVPVLVNEQRKKLSKRRDKVALEQYRAEGVLADAMVNYLMTLGWSPRSGTEIAAWSQMVDEFRLDDVNLSPAFFDEKKLWAFNGDYIRALDVEEFLRRCDPWLTAPVAPWPPDRFDLAAVRALAPFVQVRAVTFSDVPGMIEFLFQEPFVVNDDDWNKAFKTDVAHTLLVDSLAHLEACPWTTEDLKATVERVGEGHGLKLGKAQAPIRVATMGRAVGLPLFESLEVLGRERTLKRLRMAVLRSAGERADGPH